MRLRLRFQPHHIMNPQMLQNYVGETWIVDGKRGEAIGATVSGEILIHFEDGSSKACKPEELRNEHGQRVIYTSHQS